MSRPTAPIVCDGPGCGKQKQEANHWWTVETRKDIHFEMTIFAGTSTDLDPARFSAYDFCGQTCLLKWVSEQMGKVTA